MKSFQIPGRLGIFLCLAFLAPQIARAGDEAACSGHGSQVSGVCNCTTPVPDSTAPVGYVGEQCEIPVYYYMPLLPTAPDTVVPGADTVCLNGTACTELQPASSVCFWTDIGALLSFPYHFGLLLQVSPDAPQGTRFDLYGLVADGGLPYPAPSSAYNFATSAVLGLPAAHLELGSDALAGALQKGSWNAGVYLCVNNTGSEAATFNLTVATHSCPFKLMAPDGSISVCSSTPEDMRYNASASCPAGTCLCEKEYMRPHAAVFPGLGFEDCSAACTTLGSDSSPSHKVSEVEAQLPGTWRFFNFSLEDGMKYVSASATASVNTSSDLELYLKFWQPPGHQLAQYDARSASGDFRSTASSADLSCQVQVTQHDASFRQGIWYLGAWVSGDAAISYTVELFQSACPNDCSGSVRGTCDSGRGVCNCTESFFGEDCSQTYTELAANAEPLIMPPRAAFSLDHILVPGLTPLLAGGAAAVYIEASFTSGVALPAWVSSRPSLLVSGSSSHVSSDESIDSMNSSFPTFDTAEHRIVLLSDKESYELRLEAAQIQDGQLYMTLDNPLSYPYSVGYTLSVKVEAYCINDCSGHGKCSSTGTCTCQGTFIGIDCSIDVAHIGNISCLEGSLSKLGEDAVNTNHGDAFAVCICTSNPTEEGGSCQFNAPTDISQAVVMCHEGYGVHGSSNNNGVVLSSGQKVSTGGHCWHTERRGESPGMVFFWCLLSIFLAVGLVVGGKHGWKYYQAQRYAEAGGYAEMPASKSLLTTLLGGFMKRDASSNNDPW